MSPAVCSRLDEKAHRIAKKILESSNVVIASHIDADGISAAAVASSALDRANIEHEVIFLKKLDDEAIRMLSTKAENSLVWLTDLGSAYASKFGASNVVITDHHEMEEQLHPADASVQTTLFSYANFAHLNPHFFGYAGARDISGAGLAFLVAAEMDGENRVLVGLPIIGAIGDMQDLEARKLIGLNAGIVEMGVRSGRVSKSLDLRLFGSETRALSRLLEYATDPFLPGLTGNSVACEEFFKMLKIETMVNGEQRHWSSLSSAEKYKAINALSRWILENGGDEEDVMRLTGEVYIFPDERKGSPTREAREFATLLNSCGRNDMPQIGLEICKGDRGEALSRALELLREHRENISNALFFVRELGVTPFGTIQHFHCADQVKETLVGAIVGILLNSGEMDRSKPLVGFAISKEPSGEYKIKASIRGTYELVEKGLNLSSATRKAAQSVGGIGGGHNIAAGATIPLGKEEEFLIALEHQIREQLAAHISDASNTPF